MRPHPAVNRYQKIVYWSEEDDCFVGRCPGLFFGGVHGDDEAKVYAELCAAVDEHLAILDRDGIDQPPATDRAYSGTFALRVSPELHRVLAVRAQSAGDSLNHFIEQTLTAAIQPRSGRERPVR